MKSRLHSRIVLIAAVMFLSFILAASCSGSGHRKQTFQHRQQPVISVSRLETSIHALINAERRKNGLAALSWDASLAAVARSHSSDMAKRTYFDHYSPEGFDFSKRYQRDGYSCAIRSGRTIYTGAENIAQNYLAASVTTVNGEEFSDWNSEDTIAESTVKGWMNSAGHRKNILTPVFLHEGIGIFISTDGKVYITQNFC